MDLTVIAIPAYFGGMGAEYAWLKRHADERGPTAGDYERDDTITSLAMGTASLVAPIVLQKLLAPVTPGKGRYGKALVATALGAAAVATAADLWARRADGALGPAGTVPPTRPVRAGDGDLLPPASTPGDPADPSGIGGDDVAPGRERRRSLARRARKVASSAGATAVTAGAVAVATGWAHRTAGRRLWEKRIFADKGDGPLAVLGAVLAWDFVYYWNHRFAHECRWLWAMHVVHHSSERYNLSTALRQPVADAFTVSVPYGALALLGYRPDVIETARGVNLLYQFWIHTEAIGSIGRLQEVLNSPSAHRVHHGSNRQYLDRNHGSILIVWDRLFGTHAREEEPVVYGLTRNIDSHNLARVAGHEWSDIVRDLRRADGWGERLGYAFRGPGWAYERDAARGEPAAAGVA